MDYSGFDDLIVDVSDGVAVWRINRPEKLNAMRTPTFYEIIELGRMLKADDDVRVVVGTGTGRGFSSGADVGVLSPGADLSSLLPRMSICFTTWLSP